MQDCMAPYVVECLEKYVALFNDIKIEVDENADCV